LTQFIVFFYPRVLLVITKFFSVYFVLAISAKFACFVKLHVSSPAQNFSSSSSSSSTFSSTSSTSSDWSLVYEHHFYYEFRIKIIWHLNITFMLYLNRWFIILNFISINILLRNCVFNIFIFPTSFYISIGTNAIARFFLLWELKKLFSLWLGLSILLFVRSSSLFQRFQYSIGNNGSST
jgi:hypothetical protein